MTQTDAQPILEPDLHDNGVLILTMNRPDAYNSLSLALIQAIQTTLDNVVDDASVRVIILRGSGGGFCAGHDLEEVLSIQEDAGHYELLEACASMMQTIHHFPKPIIAQVHGAAFAAGCQLVATVDLAFASDDSRFSTPGVNIGLFCSTPMVALSRAVGGKQSLRMLLTGQPVSAQHAVSIGLINEAVPADQLDSYVLGVASVIASKSSYVTQMGKTAFRAQEKMPLADAYTHCNDVVVENLKANDAREGISAFLEKRNPVWSDT